MAGKAIAKTSGKRATPDAVKAKGAANMPKGSTALVTAPNAKACSLDAGITALKFVASASEGDDQIAALRQSTESNRGKAQVILALSVYKMAKLDPSVNLEAIIGADKKAANAVHERVKLGLGILVPSQTKTGKAVNMTRPDVAEIMLRAEGDDDATAKRKDSIRTNFAHMLSKCMKVALDAIQNDSKLDSVNGVLRITGPDVQKHFGQTSVLLNEQQSVQVTDKKGNVTGKTELKARPSFTEIIRKVDAAHGKPSAQRADTRPRSKHDPVKYVTDLCAALVKALGGKLPDPMPKPLTDALNSAYSALDKVLA